MQRNISIKDAIRLVRLCMTGEYQLQVLQVSIKKGTSEWITIKTIEEEDAGCVQ